MYMKLGDHERAGLWFTRIQNEVEADFGADSREAAFSIIRNALCYLRNDFWEDAEPLLQEAQRRAETAFEPDNPIKGKIAKCLVDHQYESPCVICKISCKIHPLSLRSAEP